MNKDYDHVLEKYVLGYDKKLHTLTRLFRKQKFGIYPNLIGQQTEV